MSKSPRGSRKQSQDPHPWLEIYRKAFHVNRSEQISTQSQKLLHTLFKSSKYLAMASGGARGSQESCLPISLSSCSLQQAAYTQDKPHCVVTSSQLLLTAWTLHNLHGHRILPLLLNIAPAGAGRRKSRLMTVRGINASSSLTPIQISSWRAARLPGKQVIQSSCCPVMIFSLPRLPPHTCSRSLSAIWGLIKLPRQGERAGALCLATVLAVILP